MHTICKTYAKLCLWGCIKKQLNFWGSWEEACFVIDGISDTLNINWLSWELSSWRLCTTVRLSTSTLFTYLSEHQSICSLSFIKLSFLHCISLRPQTTFIYSCVHAFEVHAKASLTWSPYCTTHTLLFSWFKCQVCCLKYWWLDFLSASA